MNVLDRFREGRDIPFTANINTTRRSRPQKFVPARTDRVDAVIERDEVRIPVDKREEWTGKRRVDVHVRRNAIIEYIVEYPREFVNIVDRSRHCRADRRDHECGTGRVEFLPKVVVLETSELVRIDLDQIEAENPRRLLRRIMRISTHVYAPTPM